MSTETTTSADTTTDGTTGPEDDAGRPEDVEADQSGGSVGQLRAALKAERQLRKDAERRARAALAGNVTVSEALRAADAEKARAVTEARTEVTASMAGQVAEARALGAAAEAGFRVPATAIRLVDLASTISADGTVSTEQIKAKLTELATVEPWLLTTYDDRPRIPKADPSQGSGRETWDQVVRPGQRGLDEANKRFAPQPGQAR